MALEFPQQIPDNEENDNGSDTTTAEFFCAVSGNQSFENVVHRFGVLVMCNCRANVLEHGCLLFIEFVEYVI